MPIYVRATFIAAAIAMVGIVSCPTSCAADLGLEPAAMDLGDNALIDLATCRHELAETRATLAACVWSRGDQ